MPVQFYPAVIDRSATGFGASFPDFPGCVAAGVSVNEAAVNAELALAFHVDAMLKDGDAIPSASDLAGIDKEVDDVASILVRVDVPARVSRVLVSIDDNLLRAIDAVAGNRSAWLADAARAALRSSSIAVASDTVISHPGFKGDIAAASLKPGRAGRPKGKIASDQPRA